MVLASLRVSVLLICAQGAQASWLSDMTGIDINLARGTVTFGTPRPDRIPQMLQNLPKDTAQFFLNPFGGGLAFAIRTAKEQARQNCSPVPPEVATRLAAFFPPDLFRGVCWVVVANGSTLDAFAIRDGGMAAITLEDVIVFRNNQLGSDAVLWSHELTHVLQYRRLGLEGFAALYSGGGWDALEQEARSFDQFVAARLQAADSNTRYWQAVPDWRSGSSFTSQQYTSAAMQYINPLQCSGWREELDPNGNPVLVEINNCPIPIWITHFVAQNRATGQTEEIPCLPGQQISCVLPPDTRTVFPYPPDYAFQRFNISWQSASVPPIVDPNDTPAILKLFPRRPKQQ